MTIYFLFFGLTWIIVMGTITFSITKSFRRGRNNYNRLTKTNTYVPTSSAKYGQHVNDVKNMSNDHNNEINQDHNHAYEHKVEPIEEASVHDLFEERKEAYRERKAQMKADLHKSSYSEAEEKEQAQCKSENNGIIRKAAKCGDNGYMPNRSEEKKNCPYCGAINIVPWEWRPDKKEVYSCYFCRQDLA